MTSMWEQTEELAKKHDADNSTWLKLANDGDKAVVAFLGEPFPREVAFVDGKYIPADDTVRAAGHKVVLRVAYNVALAETGEVKVMEQGVTFFKDLVRVREKYGLEKWAFEVQRHGAAKDPKTTYSILPERQLSSEERTAYAGAELLDLPALYSDDDVEEPKGVPSPDGGAIDAKLAAALVAQLKAMPREAVDSFLREFNLKRVKDLPALDWERARAFMEKLVADIDAPTPTGVEVDPFA